MKISILCSEIFAFGKYGGFGRSARMIAKELTLKGIEVVVIVPQRNEQEAIEYLDGFKVLGFKSLSQYLKILSTLDCDIFHSQQPSMLSYFAKNTHPQKKHIVTFRDPKSTRDWLVEIINPSSNYFKSIAAWIFENNLFLDKKLKAMDGFGYAAHFLKDKVKSIYGINQDLEFLPTPVVQRPLNLSEKSALPLICFLSRWDRRKKPEKFFNLVKEFPDVQFIAPGKSQDQKYDQYLRRAYNHLPNLELPGFINQFEGNGVYDILNKSWVLVNTSLREGLPTSFLEALANKCALLSELNPENVTRRFGIHVENNNYVSGLRELLTNNLWQEKADLGYQYISENYELSLSIKMHMQFYERMLRKS